MKIVRVIGGLGNQMFQYAFYKSLKNHYKTEIIKLDLEQFSSYKLHNGLEIFKVFNLKDYEIANKKEIKKLSLNRSNYCYSRLIRKLLKEKHTEYIEKEEFVFDKHVYQKYSNIYFEGYWQSFKYFQFINKFLIDEFCFNLKLDEKNLELLKKIKESNSLSIHVRRGDYNNHELLGGICEYEYYKKAVEYILKYDKHPKLYIFSDDHKWVIKKLVPFFKEKKLNFVNIDWNINEKSYIDMFLMSNCKNNIICNSSFSWWGAWLNRNLKKIVIAPQNWTNEKQKKFEICDERWIKI